MLIKWEFADLDELQEQLLGWDLDFLPLERGRFETRIIQRLSSDLLLSSGAFRMKVEQRGSTPKGYRTFVVPQNDDLSYNWRGKKIEGHILSLFPEDGELYSISDQRFRVHTLSFSNHLIDEVLTELRDDFICRKIRDELVWDPGSDRIERIRTLIAKIIVGPEAAIYEENLERKLLIELLDSISILDNNSRTPTTVDNSALDAVIEYIRKGDTSRSISVSDLCQIANISERTLQYRFLDRFGMTPNQYVKNYRLRQVYMNLKRNLTQQPIFKVAADHGFWHMGQFAADYRRFIGELPSETRNK